MVKKTIGSLVCGAYISIGATAFLLIENTVLGALFFTSGICLVICYMNMLVTRIFPLSTLGEYEISDIFISFTGNVAGAAIYGFLIGATRLNTRISERLSTIVEMKADDTYTSIFLMACFCGFLVAAGCLAGKVFKDNRGIAVFMCILFVAVFVVCGFEHIVANAFYFAFYWFFIEFNPELLIILIISFFGNAAGGIACGLMYKYNIAE